MLSKTICSVFLSSHVNNVWNIWNIMQTFEWLPFHTIEADIPAPILDVKQVSRSDLSFETITSPDSLKLLLPNQSLCARTS